MQGYMSQRNAAAQDYNTAARLLRRNARRGDTRAALGMIQLRQEANANGFSPGGIKRAEVEDAAAMNDFNSLTADAQRALGNTTRMNTLSGAAQPAEAPAQTELGSFAQRALGRYVTGAQPIDREDGNLLFRRGLDRALGQATTQQEIDELRRAGNQAGVTDEQFNRRSDWWNRRRPIRL